MIKLLKTLTFLIIGIVIIGVRSETYAQVDSSGFAHSIPLKEEVEQGDIICSYGDGFGKCQETHDTSIYGVIVEDVSVSIEDNELENSSLVLTNGIAVVKVTTSNGDIEEGNFVTTSEIPGVGQRATRNGFVLGTALEGYTSDSVNNVGEIQVAINIHPASGLSKGRSNLLQFIREGVAVPLFEPLESLRYLLAVLIVLLSIVIGMIYFGRVSKAGVEAMGRNPLAKRVIQMNILLHVALTVLIIIVGLVVAYLILIL